MRNRFDEQLSQLNTELITMGALCEEAISGAAKYLIDNDSALKEKVIDTDKQIDRKERDKIFAYLGRKGYEISQIKKVFSKLDI